MLCEEKLIFIRAICSERAKKLASGSFGARFSTLKADIGPVSAACQVPSHESLCVSLYVKNRHPDVEK
jgi:hypothetical protein